LFCRPTFASIDADSGPVPGIDHVQEYKLENGRCLRVDWDDYGSVKEGLIANRLLSDLLEDACQGVLSRFAQRNANNNNNTDNNDFSQQSRPKIPVRVIRKVTMESGRGFFGYSTGGAAPFIQVEYYDPSKKWLVKSVLESGQILPFTDLLGTSKSTQPYPQPPSQPSQEPPRENPWDIYEAHLPYIVQVFKDLRVSGASFIDVRWGCFREKLPPRPANNDRLDEFFHRDNTPPDLIWTADGNIRNFAANMLDKKEDDASSTSSENALTEEEILQLSQVVGDSSDSDSDDSGAPDTFGDLFGYGGRNINFIHQMELNAQKSGARDDLLQSASTNTPSKLIMDNIDNKKPKYIRRMSCRSDIELDTHVAEIINRDVEELHQKNVNNQSRRKKLNWRGVPSLRDYWEEERSRCSEYLPPGETIFSEEELSQFVDEMESQSTAQTTPQKLVPSSTIPSDQTLPRTSTRPVMELKESDVATGNTLSGVRAVHSVKELYHHTCGDGGNQGRILYDAAEAIARRYDADLKASDDYIADNRGRGRCKVKLDFDSSDDEDLEGLLMETYEKGNVLLGGPSQSSQASSFFESQSQSQSQHALPTQQVQFTQFTQGNQQIEEQIKSIRDIESDANVVLSQHQPTQHTQDMPMTQIDDFASGRILSYFDNAQQLLESEVQNLAYGPSAGEYVCDNPDSDDEESIYDEDVILQKIVDLQEKRESFGKVIQTQSSNHNLLTQLQSTQQDQTGQYFTPFTLFTQRGGELDDDEEDLDHEDYGNVDLEDVMTNDARVLEVDKKLHENLSTQMEYDDDKDEDDDGDRDVDDDIGDDDNIGDDGDIGADELQLFSQASQRRPKLSDKLPLSPQLPLSPLRSTAIDDLLSKPVQNSFLSFQLQKAPPTPSEALSSLSKTLKKSSLRQEREESSTTANTFRPLNDKPDDTQISSGANSMDLLSAANTISPAKNSQRLPRDKLSSVVGHSSGRPFATGAGTFKTTDYRSIKKRVITIMSIEIHVQCRIEQSSNDKDKSIAMTPISSKDRVFAIAYTFARDPGGGDKLEILYEGWIYVPVAAELMNSESDVGRLQRLVIGATPSKSNFEYSKSERGLLLRFSHLVQHFDPDILVSWDPKGAGIGYLIERGRELGSEDGSKELNMIRLLGRTPLNTLDSDRVENLWADRVGAGSEASRIVGRIVLNGLQIFSEEVKHFNASYQPAIVELVLEKKMRDFDKKVLTRWYGEGGKWRRRVLDFRLDQCRATLELLDELDILGRAGEAARLSNVEFDKSFPGIRGSQYRVEGILARALESLYSVDYGSKDPEFLSNFDDSHSERSSSESPWKKRRVTEIASDPNSVTSKKKIDPPSVKKKYMFMSPSDGVKATGEALEQIPMVMEPQSGFYNNPVIVCDFTALYPSLVIAYNLCYSTIGGKIQYSSTFDLENATTSGKIHCVKYDERRSASVLRDFISSEANDAKGERAIIVPSGGIFVQEPVLKGGKFVLWGIKSRYYFVWGTACILTMIT